MFDFWMLCIVAVVVVLGIRAFWRLTTDWFGFDGPAETSKKATQSSSTATPKVLDPRRCYFWSRKRGNRYGVLVGARGGRFVIRLQGWGGDYFVRRSPNRVGFLPAR